ncbi:MAG: DUF3373 family protein [Nitrospirae bacterium]|nr:DUF3373 family protein [Nitrospirota bacterium]
MKRVWGSFFVFIFILGVWGSPAIAADPSTEIEQLKEEVKRLLKRIEELEKRQVESEIKTKEAEKKVAEVEKKAEKAEKKTLKDRIELSGEARFRIVSETGKTDAGFYGGGQPAGNIKLLDETSFPVRIRLNAHAEVVPDIVDFYARLTMNKRWGAFDTSPTDPFGKPNSFEASIGHDITPRFEQAYATFKVSTLNTTWYIGRLPGLDGPPSRAERSLFPRLFIDSEIDGTLFKWDAPQTALDNIELPWTKKRLWGESRKSEKAPALKPYEAKVKDKTGIIVGYLKYDERKISAPADADVYLAQGQLKVGKDTALILSGLYMDEWHIPNTPMTLNNIASSVPDIKTDYYLTGLYADTQLLGFQLYGAGYYSHFKIPQHTYRPGGGAAQTYKGEGSPGRIWYMGFNTGDLITFNQQLCVEFAKGSDAWINPFNYRGFRRKGTVLQPANNYFYNPAGTSTVVGFYPFNAEVWDIYYDYYLYEKVRLRLGLIDFKYSKHKAEDGAFPIFGSSRYQHYWWPYFEVNISF